MTTIVVSQEAGCMAADRRVTSNDGEIIMSCPTKIEVVKQGGDSYLVGLAGLEAPGLIWLNWFKDGADPENPPEPMYGLDDSESFSIVVYSKKGLYVVDKFMRMVALYDQKYYGVGTGGSLAWAILEAGCDVHTAMKTACKMDPYSGGGYDVVYLNKPKERLYYDS